jgi:hypothetical protein
VQCDYVVMWDRVIMLGTRAMHKISFMVEANHARTLNSPEHR